MILCCEWSAHVSLGMNKALHTDVALGTDVAFSEKEAMQMHDPVSQSWLSGFHHCVWRALHRHGC
jgi:hypothetical protein